MPVSQDYVSEDGDRRCRIRRAVVPDFAPDVVDFAFEFFDGFEVWFGISAKPVGDHLTVNPASFGETPIETDCLIKPVNGVRPSNAGIILSTGYVSAPTEPSEG